MKKISNHYRWFIKKQNLIKHRKELKAAKRIIFNRIKSKNFYKQFKLQIDLLEARNLFLKRHYKADYKKKLQIIEIEGELGIEDPAIIDYTLDKAAEIIDFNTKELRLNINKCTRIWPSAVTLFCSLMQWVELSARNTRPIIRSTNSESDRVNSYLSHCGFYDYVKRIKDSNNEYYKNEQIVKIRREKNYKNVEEREEEIIKLLQNFGTFSDEEIEIFHNIILVEILGNASEHGVTKKDKGWWLLAQYHPSHKFISICIADNGIGFRNTLMTGAQQNEISDIYENLPENDGNLIKFGLEEEFSGALSEPPHRTGYLIKRYKPGSKRGQGLKHVKRECKNLNIGLNILSQFGYLFIDNNGKEVVCGAKHKRVFAGTLFQLNMKAK